HKLFLGLESGALGPECILGPCDGPHLARALFRTYRPMLYADHAECLRLMTGYVVAAKLPWPEQRVAARSVMPDGPPRGVGYVAPRLVLPACDKFTDAGLKSRASLLATAAALACERFRQANGRWPRSLAEIPEPILAAVPASPFDGRP